MIDDPEMQHPRGKEQHQRHVVQWRESNVLRDG